MKKARPTALLTDVCLTFMKSLKPQNCLALRKLNSIWNLSFSAKDLFNATRTPHNTTTDLGRNGFDVGHSNGSDERNRSVPSQIRCLLHGIDHAQPIQRQPRGNVCDDGRLLGNNVRQPAGADHLHISTQFRAKTGNHPFY
jgi:hypothetical protein